MDMAHERRPSDSGNEYVDANAVFSQVILYRNVTLIAWDSFPLLFLNYAQQAFFFASVPGLSHSFSSLLIHTKIEYIGSKWTNLHSAKDMKRKKYFFVDKHCKKYSLSDIKYHSAWCKCIHDYSKYNHG